MTCSFSTQWQTRVWLLLAGTFGGIGLTALLGTRSPAAYSALALLPFMFAMLMGIAKSGTA